MKGKTINVEEHVMGRKDSILQDLMNKIGRYQNDMMERVNERLKETFYKFKEICIIDKTYPSINGL
jgi:hypothetical protein